MPTANRLELQGLKGLMLRLMNAAVKKGLYVVRGGNSAHDVDKMPPGLMRIKKAHEIMANAQKPDVLNINFVFERTIPALHKNGAFEGMSEAEADGLISKLVSFASQSMDRARERKSRGEDVESYCRSIQEFFTSDLVSYSGWIARKKEIDEIIAFKAGIRSTDEQTRINAIRRAGEVGMTEAADDLLHILSTGSNKEKLEVIDVMQKLGLESTLIAALDSGNPSRTKEIEFTDLSSRLPKGLEGTWGDVLASAGDKIYIYGGSAKVAKGPYAPKKGLGQPDFLSYDTRTGELKSLNAELLHQERDGRDHGMVQGPDGKLYYLKSGEEWLIYDPLNDSWTRNRSAVEDDNLANEENSRIVAGRDGKIYFFGGYDKMNDLRCNTLWTYDAGSGKWEEIRTRTPASLAVRDSYYMVMGADNKIYLFSGFVKGKLLRDLWSFDLEKKRWTPLGSRVPKQLKNTSAHEMFAGPDGKIYIFHFLTNNGPKTTEARGLWSYDPEEDVFEDLTARVPKELQARHYHSIVMGPGGKSYLFCQRIEKRTLSETHSLELWEISFPAGPSVIEEAKQQLREGK